MYITSDDVIQVGDWFLTDDRDKKSDKGGNPNWILCKCTKTSNSWVFCGEFEEIGLNPYWSRKIIATTNKSLGLLSPSQAFIDKYCQQFNIGNPIIEVLVDYYLDFNLGVKQCKEGIDAVPTAYIPKVDSSNEITITRIKIVGTKKR